ncbi:MAG: hypothetical protein GX995_02795 [Clostridiales bacterium]|nr:hypothetical protein [Clostridiales bacterium]
MKEQLEVKFHDVNDKEETAVLLCDLIVDMLVTKVEENPKKYYELILAIMNGDEIEDGSLL